MELITILESLCSVYGPSGREERIREAIENMLPGKEMYTDALGNLIVHLGGQGEKIVFSAHMDTIGLMVSHIDEKGFVSVREVGYILPAEILHTPVVFENGIRALVCTKPEADLKELKTGDLYLDLGAKSREEAEKLVSIGDVAVFHNPLMLQNGRVMSPYLDNRSGCAVLVKAAEEIKAPKNDVYLMFSAQEEAGAWAAGAGAFGIDAKYGVAIDVTISDDVPGAAHESTAKMGCGAAIKVCDGSVLCRPEMIAAMHRAAQENDIPVQTDVAAKGGTDAGPMSKVRSGMVTGGISVPCRYMHAPMEMVELNDMEACVRLVTALAETEIKG